MNRPDHQRAGHPGPGGKPQGWPRREFVKLGAAATLGAALPAAAGQVDRLPAAEDPGQQAIPPSGDDMMLKGRLIHPQILEALGRAGHGSQVLIADGNYPFSTKLGPKAKLVNVNLSPGIVSCTQVLEALVTAIPVEAAAVMGYAKTGPYALPRDPEIWDEFRTILHRGLGKPLQLEEIERFQFYETAGSPNVALTIATADQRIYANLLLTIGVVMPP